MLRYNYLHEGLGWGAYSKATGVVFLELTHVPRNAVMTTAADRPSCSWVLDDMKEPQVM